MLTMEITLKQYLEEGGLLESFDLNSNNVVYKTNSNDEGYFITKIKPVSNVVVCGETIEVEKDYLFLVVYQTENSNYSIVCYPTDVYLTVGVNIKNKYKKEGKW